MVKNQDILILLDNSQHKFVGFDEQKKRADEYYNRAFKSVLVKTISIRGKAHKSKAREIREMLKIGRFRIVIAHRSLISNSLHLLKLFNDTDDIDVIDGHIERKWLKARIASIVRRTKVKPSQPRPRPLSDKLKPELYDMYGLPILNGGEYSVLNTAQVNAAIKKERKLKREREKAKIRREKRRMILHEKEQKYKEGDYKKAYDAISWHTPVDKIMTSEHFFKKAYEFHLIMRPHIKTTPTAAFCKLILVNAPSIPKNLVSPFKEIVNRKYRFIYESESKKNNRRLRKARRETRNLQG